MPLWRTANANRVSGRGLGPSAGGKSFTDAHNPDGLPAGPSPTRRSASAPHGSVIGMRRVDRALIIVMSSDFSKMIPFARKCFPKDTSSATSRRVCPSHRTLPWAGTAPSRRTPPFPVAFPSLTRAASGTCPRRQPCSNSRVPLHGDHADGLWRGAASESALASALERPRHARHPVGSIVVTASSLLFAS